jgi:hypothetical protein
MAFWACFCAALTITVSEESSYTPYGGTIFALVWVCASRAAVVRREQLERCREGHRRKELEELREGYPAPPYSCAGHTIGSAQGKRGVSAAASALGVFRGLFFVTQQG